MPALPLKFRLGSSPSPSAFSPFHSLSVRVPSYQPALPPSTRASGSSDVLSLWNESAREWLQLQTGQQVCCGSEHSIENVGQDLTSPDNRRCSGATQQYWQQEAFVHVTNDLYTNLRAQGVFLLFIKDIV